MPRRKFHHVLTSDGILHEEFISHVRSLEEIREGYWRKLSSKIDVIKMTNFNVSLKFLRFCKSYVTWTLAGLYIQGTIYQPSNIRTQTRHTKIISPSHIHFMLCMVPMCQVISSPRLVARVDLIL